jgi:hypothetical protein
MDTPSSAMPGKLNQTIQSYGVMLAQAMAFTN